MNTPTDLTLSIIIWKKSMTTRSNSRNSRQARTAIYSSFENRRISRYTIPAELNLGQQLLRCLVGIETLMRVLPCKRLTDGATLRGEFISLKLDIIMITLNTHTERETLHMKYVDKFNRIL